MIRLGIAGLALALALVAGVLGLREYTAFQQLDAGQDEVMVGLIQDPDSFVMVPAYSLRTQRAQMLTCMEWQSNSLHARHFPPTRQSLARACAARAQQILDKAPTYSAAHVALAYSHWNLGDLPAAKAALDQARATAASPGWLAARRLRLALQIGADADTPADMRDAVLAAAVPDLQIASEGGQGIDNVARLYLSFPAMQDWIVTQIEQLDPDTQRQFLNRVRTLSRDAAA
jgi:hypothetical protein